MKSPTLKDLPDELLDTVTGGFSWPTARTAFGLGAAGGAAVTTPFAIGATFGGPIGLGLSAALPLVGGLIGGTAAAAVGGARGDVPDASQITTTQAAEYGAIGGATVGAGIGAFGFLFGGLPGVPAVVGGAGIGGLVGAAAATTALTTRDAMRLHANINADYSDGPRPEVPAPEPSPRNDLAALQSSFGAFAQQGQNDLAAQDGAVAFNQEDRGLLEEQAAFEQRQNVTEFDLAAQDPPVVTANNGTSFDSDVTAPVVNASNDGEPSQTSDEQQFA